MENESTPEPTTTAEIERNINELRVHPAYMDRKHLQHKDINDQITGLYKKKHDVGKSQNGNGKPSANLSVEPPIKFSGAPSGNGEPSGDLATQAQAELDKLAEITGDNYSDVDLSGVTSARLEGIKHLQLIEENDFEQLGGSLSNAALKAGMPVESASFLHTFVQKIAQPNDELTKILLTDIAEYICKTRKG